MTVMVPQQPALLSVSNLTIATPNGTVLIENSSFSMRASEVVVLVGPSGTGKSTIINVLSGLLRSDSGDRWRVSGTLTCNGEIFDLARDPCDVGGLVFQDNALFDDLTALENLSIAAAHSATPDEGLIEQAIQLLADVPPDQPVSACSGGQQQRLAIARTLLANRPVLLFDEPNSGLDKRASRRLASMVKELCAHMGKPALIVAHHVDDLLPVADQVLLLDPRAKTLRRIEVDRDTVERELLALDYRSTDMPDAEPGMAAGNAWSGRVSGKHRSWLAHYLGEYFWVLCASPLMLLYIGIGAMIIGFVSIWFGFNYETVGDYVKSLVHDDALMGIGFIQATVAVPLLTCILIVARNNAIIAADIGNRVLSSQLRAMRNLHIPARRYLVTSILVNMVVGSVLLVAVSLAVASWTSLQTWRILFPQQPFELWQENFFRAFLRGPGILIESAGWIFLKTVLSVALASLVAICIGLTRKTSLIAINYAVAQAIVLGVSITLFTHAVIAVFQF